MLTVLISFAGTLVSAPWVRRSMTRLGVVDRPNHRSSHTAVTPRGGGLACLVGATAAVVASVAARGLGLPWAAIGAAVGLCAVGYLDDRRSLPAVPRLLIQASAGVAMGAAAGGASWAVIGAVVVPFIVNVVNFMDGINGITGLHVGWWGLFVLWLGTRDGLPTLAFVGALCAGSALGFLPANFPHAKMFLGDAGSYLLGGLLAAGVLYGGANLSRPALVLIPLTLYLADTVSTLARRLLTRAPLMTAHRNHVYQQLTSQLGYSHACVALTMVGTSVVITTAWTLLPAAGLVVALTASVIYFNAPRLLPAAKIRTEA